MPIAGLTGSFGTGKTYVASIFKKLGAGVLDSDKIAHEAIRKGTAAHKKITGLFGRSILGTEGSINRKTLGKIVFNDKRRLGELEKIVHPYVIKKIKERIKGLGENEVLIIDAPLIYETGLAGLMDVMVVVKASKKKQVQRCIKKFHMKERDVRRRIARQMPLEIKIKKADYVIDNDGSKENTKRQVKQIWLKIRKGEKVWR